MVLLASILAISFSLVTSPNAFASQVWESSIAKFTYPDNWNIVLTIGNGEGIILQPINEPNVYAIKLVFQDSAHGFSNMVEAIKQTMMNTGFQIVEIQNVPGEYIFSKSGFNNGIDWEGVVLIQQTPNSNDVVISEYTSESSKAQQYNDGSGFFVSTYLSPIERGVPQYSTSPLSPIERGVPQYSTSPEDFLSGYLQWADGVLNSTTFQDLIRQCMENPGLCPSSPSSDDEPGLHLDWHIGEDRAPTIEFGPPP